ncbi:glycosyltransferase family 1 protein [Priestia megaterium]
MNIGFDMTFAATPSNDRGIGFYSRQLIKSIQLSDPENRYFFFHPDSSNKGLIEQLDHFITKNQIDIYHVLSPCENYEHLPIERKRWGKTKFAATLHDIIPLLFPKQYLPLPEIKKDYMKILDFVKSCDIIFAISDTTKQDAIKHLQISPNKINVIYAGLCDHFTSENQLVKTKWTEIEKSYILYVGGSDYRKNLNRLIDAFGKLNDKLLNEYQFVIAGSISNTDKFFLDLKIKKNNLTKNIIFTGYVSNEEIVQLYKGADLFAFPSLYEGFGLPVLEAMACGTPVLTSNNSSLKEITDQAAYLVNPRNIEEIAYGINYILTREEARKSLKEKGLKQADKFQWTNVAKNVLEGYRSLLE